MSQPDPVQAEPSNSDSLLKLLRDGVFFERKRAVEDLGKLPQSSEPVISALMHTAQTDSDPGVRSAAIRTMEMPIHYQYLRARNMLGTLTDVKRQSSAQELAAHQEAQPQQGGGWGLIAFIGQAISAIMTVLALIADRNTNWSLICGMTVVIFVIVFVVSIWQN
jgi:precorrin isomerase